MNAPLQDGQMPAEIGIHAHSLPLISRERFAQYSGFPEGVVQGWIQRGYLPTYTIGKYTLINLALLNKMALEKAPWL